MGFEANLVIVLCPAKLWRVYKVSEDEYGAPTTEAPLEWVPGVPRNPSIFEQWALEPIDSKPKILKTIQYETTKKLCWSDG